MDLFDFASAIAHGVAQDTVLQSWATAHFSKPMQIYLGIASVDLPGLDDAPFLVIEEMGRVGGQESRNIEYAMGCWMMLSNETYEVVADGNLIIPAGVQYVFDGMRNVRLAVASNLPNGAVISEYEQYADANGNGAEVNGFMAFTFIEHLTIGQDPLE